MKIFSNIEFSKLFLSLFLFSWIIGLCLLVVNHALSCVTSDGCLKSQCKYEWLRTEYQQLIDKNSFKCANRNITSRWFIIRNNLNNIKIT